MRVREIKGTANVIGICLREREGEGEGGGEGDRKGRATLRPGTICFRAR